MTTRKIALIVLALIALTAWVIDHFSSAESPGWSPLELTSLALAAAALLIISIPIGYIIIRSRIFDPIKRCLVTRYGIRTVGTVVNSSRCYDPEDTCLCGAYTFSDLQGKEHEFDFKVCIHWPSDEQWMLVKQTYAVGAQHPVHYLRRFPFIHEIRFPI